MITGLSYLGFFCLFFSADIDLIVFRAHYQSAIEAYQKQDLAAFLAQAETAHRLYPQHAPAALNLAAAYALNERQAEAIGVLAGLAKGGLFLDIRAHRLFGGMKDVSGFEALASDFERNREPKGQKSRPFLRLAQKDFFPEGIAYDNKRDAFLVSSVHHRKIVRVTRDGSVSDLVREGQDGIWSVLGLAVDQQRGHLWACSSAFPETKDGLPGEEGRSGLFQFDLDTGSLIAKHLTPVGEQHGFGDLTVSSGGEVFAADSKTGQIFRLDAQGKFEVWLAAGSLRSPQGMCFSADGRTLFVADYSNGILAIDTATRAWRLLEPGANQILTGIDGLVFHKGSLIAIQNGIAPQRVVRWTLNAESSGLTNEQVLESAHPDFDEPTLGTIVNGEFIFIANSQWGKYDKNHKPLPVESLAEIQIRTIGL